MTSLAFMFVEVPAPPWIMSMVKCLCSFPAMISSQAAMMASALSGIEHAEFLVRHGGGLFHVGEAADEVAEVVERDAGNRKILHAAQRLHAVVGGVRQLALTERIVLLAPGGDDRGDAGNVEFVGRLQPRAQPPRDVADHSIEHLRLLRADAFENGARNQADLHIGQRHAGGGVRQIVQQHALAEGRAAGEGGQTGRVAVISPDDFHLALLDDAHPQSGHGFVEQPCSSRIEVGLTFADEGFQLVRRDGHGLGQAGDALVGENRFVFWSHGIRIEILWPNLKSANPKTPVLQQSTVAFIGSMHSYARSEGISTTGGYVYRGRKLRGLKGNYQFGDWGGGGS